MYLEYLESTLPFSLIDFFRRRPHPITIIPEEVVIVSSYAGTGIFRLNWPFNHDDIVFYRTYDSEKYFIPN
jgi:hypothetical protein